MEVAFARKTDEKKQSQAPPAALPDEQLSLQGELGAPAGMPLFLQGGQTAFRSIQTKLAVGQRGDIYEQEADRVEERVVRSPCQSPIQHVQSSPALQCKCAGCASGAPCQECEEEEETEGLVQRKVEPGHHGENIPPVGDLLPSLGSGRPLDSSTRTFFEPRFDHDFSQVRIHDDAQAAESARRLNARAFTAGHDVVFAPEEFSTGTDEGRRLLAHELTHVVQQGHAGTAPRRVLSDPSDTAERQARATSVQIDGLSGLASVAAPDATIQRDGPAGNAPPLPAGVLPAAGPIEKSPPVAGSETITFEGVLLSTDPEFVRWQLEQMIAERGEGDTQGFVNRMLEAPRTDEQKLESNKKLAEDLAQYGPGDVSGAPLSPDMTAEIEHRVQNKERTQKTTTVVQEQFTRLVKENKEFLGEFEAVGERAVYEALSQSEGKVYAEAKHYGISESLLSQPPELRSTAFPQPRTALDVQREAAGEKLDRQREAQAAGPRKRLVEAAKELQKKRNEIAELQRKAARPASSGSLFPAPQTPFDAIPLVKAQGEYDTLRRAKQAEFPILASFAKEGGNLGTIIGAGGDLNLVLAREMSDKLDNIRDTRGYFRDGKVTLWDIPVIVEGTRRKLAIDKGTMHDRVVQDRYAARRKEKQEAKEEKEAISTLAFVLGLLAAIPTGGGSLAVATAVAGGTSAVLGAYVALSDVQEYMVQSAASGTDFDKAAAISQEEPSLFWLAVEVVGTVLDLGMAASTFRSLSGLRRAAIAGEREASELLRAEGNRLGRQLGDRMVAEAEKLQKGGTAVTGKAKDVGKLIDKEALEAGKLAEAAVEGVEKHEIIVTKSGAFRCSKRCGDVLWLYEDVLKGRADLQAEMAAALKQGEAGAQKVATITQRMDRIRQVRLIAEEDLEAAIKANAKGTSLGDELRFERYRRGGGLAEYGDWFSMSRGGRAGGPVHEGIRNDIVSSKFPGSTTEVQVGNRFADAFTPAGPGNPKPIYHQIGDVNPVRGDPIPRERQALTDIRKTVGDGAEIYFWPKSGGGPLINPDRDARWLKTWTLE